MRRHSAQFLLVASVLMSAPIVACAARADAPASVIWPAADVELSRIASAVRTALTSKPPRGYARIPKGVRLLGVTRRADSIALDFSEDLLLATDDRTLEDALHQILMAASNARSAQPADENAFTVLVNGARLDAYRP